MTSIAWWLLFRSFNRLRTGLPSHFRSLLNYYFCLPFVNTVFCGVFPLHTVLVINKTHAKNKKKTFSNFKSKYHISAINLLNSVSKASVRIKQNKRTCLSVVASRHLFLGIYVHIYIYIYKYINTCLFIVNTLSE